VLVLWLWRAGEGEERKGDFVLFEVFVVFVFCGWFLQDLIDLLNIPCATATTAFFLLLPPNAETLPQTADFFALDPAMRIRECRPHPSVPRLV